jgi:hypothetical protein
LAAARIRLRVAAGMLGSPRSESETVITDTPVTLATSFMETDMTVWLYD